MSPRGSPPWEKLTPTQGPTRPSRKNPAAHFLPIFLTERAPPGSSRLGPQTGPLGCFLYPTRWEEKGPADMRITALQPVQPMAHSGQCWSLNVKATCSPTHSGPWEPTPKCPKSVAPTLGKAGGEARELELGSGGTTNSGEGRLRKPSQGPHGTPALASAPRPQPRSQRIRENSDPSETGSKGLTKAPT